MTDVRGLLRDKNDEDTIIPVVNVSDVPKLQMQGVISGGMIPKIDCCVEAVRRGVGRAHIIDGRIPHSILIELFSDEGIGTMLY
jgi:acetylglutamate kinase